MRTLRIRYYMLVLIVVLYSIYFYYLVTRYNLLKLKSTTKDLNSEDFKKLEQSYKLLVASKDLFLMATQLKMVIIVIDNGFLETLSSLSFEPENPSEASVCHYFCRNVNHLTVATFDRFWLDDSVITKRFSSIFNMSTLRVLQNEAVNKLYTNDNRPKSHHILLQHIKTNVMFHLVVLHKIAQDYYWFDQIDVAYSLKNDSITDQLQHGVDHPGVFIKQSLNMRKIHIDTLNVRIPEDIPRFIRSSSESKLIMCNESIKEQFEISNHITTDHHLHPSFDSIFQSKASTMLSIVTKTFNLINMPFWLSSGTCLGWYRQCRLFESSNDVDIGVWAKDYQPDIIELLQRERLDLAMSFGMISDSYELVFYYKGLKLDIFFFYDGDDRHVWNGGTDAKTGAKYKYTFDKFTLCWTFFMNLFLRVPCETKIYVENNYGTNWMKRVEAWDWRKSPSNVEEVLMWPTEEWKEAIKKFY